MIQQQFLCECGKSYPEVMAALAYFRQLAQDKCEGILRKRLKELAGVLGVAMQHLQFKAYADPDKPAPVTSYDICLGEQAKVSENLSVYSYLYWLSKPVEDSEPQGVEIDIWINDGSKREKLKAKLEKEHETPRFKADKRWNCGPAGQSYGFWMGVAESDFPKFDEELDKLFDYTIDFLKSVDGISNYFKPQKVA